jgi:DNA recombination protein RmuC
MDTAVVILLLVALAGGALVGWFLGSRPTAEWKTRHAERDAAAKEHQENFKRAIAELGEARIELATLKANAENFDKQIEAMRQAREELLAQFKATGSEVLSKAQEQFLAAATERFGHAEQANKEAVKSLLDPVHQRLKSYEEQVVALEAKRADAFGQLTGLIDSMRIGQEQVKTEAMRLGNTLRHAPKTRGQWGENQLRNVLEQCGLSEHTDFITEHSVESNDGRLRPDALVLLPGNKLLVIDAKVSLNHFEDACNALDEEERNAHFKKHAAAVRSHIQSLAAKSYQSQFPNAPDYVIMFVPGENHLAAALEHGRYTEIDKDGKPKTIDLWTYAFQQRVLLAGPANLVAIARTVSEVWRQDGLASEAREIGRMGAELYDRLAVSAEHLKRVGSGLESAVGNYNKFVGSFERNVLSAGRRLRDKHIEIGKRKIEDVPLVESAPRYTGGDVEEPAPVRLVGGTQAEEVGESG